MKFRTEYTPPRMEGTLDPSQPLLFLGSCFSDNIGARVLDARWEAAVNPCGTLFNPFSIGRVVRLAAMDEPHRQAEVERRLFEADGRWRSWDFSTLFSAASRCECADICMEALGRLRDSISTAGCVIITLGTAWVYRHCGEVVGNCHKQPEKIFTRSLATAEAVTAELRDTVAALRSVNPDVRVMFTLSPVRHLRDGMSGNSLSKATLRVAIGVLESEGHLYFPAFEILTDDLRDYRFYADDLLHPSPAGVQYIWEKFSEQYLTAGARERLLLGEAATRRSRHHTLHTPS